MAKPQTAPPTKEELKKTQEKLNELKPIKGESCWKSLKGLFGK